jgi:hypothetical protein
LTLEHENYITTVMPLAHRSALAKFRCRVSPIRLKMVHYEQLDINDRLCPICTDGIEDEIHVLLYCNLYNDIDMI